MRAVANIKLFLAVRDVLSTNCRRFEQGSPRFLYVLLVLVVSGCSVLLEGNPN